MNPISVSDLKAQLSEQLRHVKEGETLVVTERGRAVARIVPVEGADRYEADLMRLMEAGALRPGTGTLDPAFWELVPPSDPGGGVLQALIAARQEGR